MSIIPYKGALLNPRRDATFKTLFTQDSDNARLALKSFLEAILEVPISHLQLAPNELSAESIDDRQTRFDVTCVIGDERANIEMQNVDVFTQYANRIEYHVAHLLNHYTSKGRTWQDVAKVFQVSVVNFIFDRTSPDAISHYQMRTEDNRCLNGRLNAYVLELPKFQIPEVDIEKLTSRERWCIFLLYADNPEKQKVIRAICNAEAGIMAASTILSEISQDEANWLAQDSRDMAERDWLSLQQAYEESQQIKAEYQRLQAEKLRMIAETQQMKAETQRLQDETLRMQDEAQQMKAEKLRMQDETQQMKAELADKDAQIALLQAQLDLLKEK